MKEKEANIKILQTIFNHKYGILAVALSFFIISIGISLSMDKKYAAQGIVYPTKSNEIKKEVNDPGFGYQIHTDRLVQLFESNQMRNEMVDRFNLIQYYELDTTSKNWVSKLIKKYEEDITIDRTKYLSVVINAEFKSPELAAEMVNNMISYVDTLRRNIYLENTQILVDDLKPKMALQEMIVDSLLDRISNASEQGNENALSQNTIAQINKRKENGHHLNGDDAVKKALLNNYSVQLEKLISQYYLELGILNGYQSQLILANDRLSMPFPKIYTVTSAMVNSKKTSPKNLINGLIGLVLGLLCSVFYYSIADNLSVILDDLKSQ
ncbi:MAG: hypothetical protein ACPGRC_07040 [Salibacteraceae bacterium]